MPLPKPNKGEEHDKFMDRCMGNDFMVDEYPDNDQRYAVCQSIWDRKDKKAEDIDMETTAQTPNGFHRMEVPAEELEIREDGKTPRLVGYAAKFGKPYDMRYFFEQIDKKAFNAALEKSDVRALKNHDPNLLLGRTSSGTLRLSTNTVGLQFDIDVPDTTTGRDTLEEVRRGDLQGASFAFTVTGEKWEDLDTEKPKRTITEIGELFDVGPVTYPANPDTAVAARMLQEARSTYREEMNQLPIEQAFPVERQREIDKQYRKMGRIIKRNKQADV